MKKTFKNEVYIKAIEKALKENGKCVVRHKNIEILLEKDDKVSVLFDNSAVLMDFENGEIKIIDKNEKKSDENVVVLDGLFDFVIMLSNNVHVHFVYFYKPLPFNIVIHKKDEDFVKKLIKSVVPYEFFKRFFTSLVPNGNAMHITANKFVYKSYDFKEILDSENEYGVEVSVKVNDLFLCMYYSLEKNNVNNFRISFEKGKNVLKNYC